MCSSRRAAWVTSGRWPCPAVPGFGSCVRLLLADTQAFQRFGAADLQHEAAVESAVFGPENNLLVTASRDAHIQVQADP